MSKLPTKTFTPPATSHLRKVTYLPHNHTLLVNFKGGQYTYPDVDPKVFNAMKRAKHPGSILYRKVIHPG